MRFGIIKKISACAAAFALIAGLTACGSETTSIPQGKVVKGPVAGATVYDSNGHAIGVTDSNGNFPLLGTGPYTTSGGQYTDLSDGQTHSAPVMKAPAGATNITALTTLIQNAIEQGDQAIADNLKAAIQGLGIAYDAPLNSVSSDGTNRAAIALNEIVGAMLADQTPSATELENFTTNLITELNSLPDNIDLTNAGSIVDAIENAAEETNISIENADSYANAVNIILPDNPLPPPVTGTTGGTSGSGGTTIN